MALSNVRWKGVKAIEEMTKVLPTKIANQKMREAIRFSLTPLRNDMRSKLPRKTGKLWFATDITIGTGSKLEDFYGVVGPRRKKGIWNQQGWHAHLIEKGTKRHVIKSKNGSMPVYSRGKLVGYFKEIEVKGIKGRFPYKSSIDSNYGTVGKAFSDKVSDILVQEIKNIKSQYGDL